MIIQYSMREPNVTKSTKNGGLATSHEGAEFLVSRVYRMLKATGKSIIFNIPDGNHLCNVKLKFSLLSRQG